MVKLNSMNKDDHKKVLVKDIMTRRVISVAPETSITDAARIITEHNFAGLPVIDSYNKLVGILTEYDLITRTSSLNVSFLQRILTDIYSAKNNEEPREGEISGLTVKDVMNPEPLTLSEDATFEDIIKTFKDHHRVNPIPIVDKEGGVVGIISRFDVLRPLNILSYGKSK